VESRRNAIQTTFGLQQLDKLACSWLHQADIGFRYRVPERSFTGLSPERGYPHSPNCQAVTLTRGQSSAWCRPELPNYRERVLIKPAVPSPCLKSAWQELQLSQSSRLQALS